MTALCSPGYFSGRVIRYYVDGNEDTSLEA